MARIGAILFTLAPPRRAPPFLVRGSAWRGGAKNGASAQHCCIDWVKAFRFKILKMRELATFRYLLSYNFFSVGEHAIL